MKRWTLLLAGAWLLAGPAYAESLATPPGSVVSPKRPMPSYGARKHPQATFDEFMLVIRRVIFAPLYLLDEYVFRRPLSVAVPAAEKADVFTKVYDFFVFGADHKAGIVPVANGDLKFDPSVGVYAFWKDAGFTGHDLYLRAEAWPDDVLAVDARQRVDFGKDRTFQLHVGEVHRPDRVFYGIGPNALESHESRYGLQRASGDASYEWRFWRSSRIETTLALRNTRVFDGHYGRDPSLMREASMGAFPIPYGFGSDYTAETNRIVAALDTRVPEARRGSGIRLEIDGEQGSNLSSLPRSGWIRYGATAAGYIDLTGYRRVLDLAVTTQFVDPLGGSPLPFTELVYLGGDHAMRGFYAGRLLGRSAAVATLTYQWPIGPWLDAELQFALGNVFGEHLSGLDAGLLRLSGAFGLSVGRLQTKAVMGAEDAPIEILVGVGSETFDRGGQIDSVRLVAGVPLNF